MELRQLEHFVAVAEEQQFTRAARRVHLVQSSLSASIQALERELGTPLMTRSSRGVQLTEAGGALLPGARRTLAAAAGSIAAVDAIRGLVRGSLAVGYVQASSPVGLAPVVAALRRRHPGITIQLRSFPVPAMLQAITDGELDIAIVDGPVAARGLRTIPLARAPIVLITPPGHPLSGRRTVRLAALGETDFVEYQARSALRAMLDDACARVGVRRRVVCEADTVPMLLDCVASGVGAALVPASLAPVGSVKVTPAIQRELVVVVSGDRPPSPAATAFLSLLDSGRA